MSRTDFKQLSEDYRRVEQAIRFIETNARTQPELGEVAAALHLSEYHFQRLFTRWAGISPKRFLQFLTKENAKQLLARSANLLDATYETGLSSPGRLHDLFITCEAVTPGEYKNHGQGMQILYGFHPTPFGDCLLALTQRGICYLAFITGDRDSALDKLRKEWANAHLQEDPARTKPVIEQIFAPQQDTSLGLHLRGTNFQLKVWEALLRLPSGSVVAYEDLARQVGSGKAAQAVGNALAHNPVAYLIPCHRVLRKAGDFGGYRYGALRKKAILGWEMAQTVPGSSPSHIPLSNIR